MRPCLFEVVAHVGKPGFSRSAVLRSASPFACVFGRRGAGFCLGLSRVNCRWRGGRSGAMVRDGLHPGSYSWGCRGVRARGRLHGRAEARGGSRRTPQRHDAENAVGRRADAWRFEHGDEQRGQRGATSHAAGVSVTAPRRRVAARRARLALPLAHSELLFSDTHVSVRRASVPSAADRGRRG